MRFLLVDVIEELEPGVRASGAKNVTLSEDFLADHFPDRPIMPGVLILESLVQLADWLARSTTDFASIGLAAGFDRIKFRKVVRPGDRLGLTVEVTDRDGDRWVVKGRASTDQGLAASATITMALEPLDTYLDADEARRLFAVLDRTADTDTDTDADTDAEAAGAGEPSP